MANEIQISSAPGLTLSLQLYDGVSPVGSAFSATEIGTTGEYISSMPSNIPYGYYLVLATTGANVKIASGDIRWDGNYEILNSLAKIQGLDSNNPVITTPTSIDSGNMHINITGDGVTSTVLTRND